MVEAKKNIERGEASRGALDAKQYAAIDRRAYTDARLMAGEAFEEMALHGVTLEALSTLVEECDLSNHGKNGVAFLLRRMAKTMQKDVECLKNSFNAIHDNAIQWRLDVVEVAPTMPERQGGDHE